MTKSKRKPAQDTGGYLGLLRSNRDFRNLWYAQTISQTGDWLNHIALFEIVFLVTGSKFLAGLIIITRLLPAFFLSPIAGWVADRLYRKHIMVLCDVLRALTALAFLLVRDASEIWLVYVLLVLLMGLSTFFQPAKTASIPNLVTPAQLYRANTLTSITWSMTLALGAALGGLITEYWGTDAAFILDGLTFFVSAAFVARVRLPRMTSEQQRQLQSPLHMMRDGFRFIAAHPPVTWLVFCKAMWGMSGGVLLLITIFGKEIFVLGSKGALSMGLFYCARGIGTGIGPVLARSILGERVSVVRKALGPSFFFGCAYVFLGLAPNIWVALLLVILAHMGGSTQWVFSTLLLQKTLPDHIAGRVFATEFGLLTLVFSISNFFAGVAMEQYSVTPQTLTVVFGLMYIAPGIAYSLRLWSWPDGKYAPIQEEPGKEIAPVATPGVERP
jgi:MFS family permease